MTNHIVFSCHNYSRIKFGCFYDAIAERGFDYVASGHYAQLVKVKETKFRLKLSQNKQSLSNFGSFFA